MLCRHAVHSQTTTFPYADHEAILSPQSVLVQLYTSLSTTPTGPLSNGSSNKESKLIKKVQDARCFSTGRFVFVNQTALLCEDAVGYFGFYGNKPLPWNSHPKLKILRLTIMQ